MSFLNPFFLLALLAIAVPLLIHLINLRKPKKVRFSTLGFFKSLQSSALRRIKIKQWLLLALRVLAILMLAIALARPFMPSDFGSLADRNQPRAIAIMIDNSPSMDRVDQFGPYIDQVRRVASEIIERSGREDRIILEVTNGEALDLPAMTSGESLTRVNEIETLNKGNFIAENLSGLIYRLENSPQPVRELYLLTDAQATQIEQLERRIGDPYERGLRVITVGTDQLSNVTVTDLELGQTVISSEQPVNLRANVRNFGDTPIENHFLSLEIDEEIAGQYAVKLEPGEENDYLFEVVPGNRQYVNGRFLIEGDELTFDNQRFFTIRIPDKRKILIVENESRSEEAFNSYLEPMIEAAVSANDLLEVEWRQWDSGLLSGSDNWDAVVLDGVGQIPEYLIEDLISFAQQGGGIFFLPSADGDITSYNRFLERTNVGRFSGIRGNYGSFETVDQIVGLREGHPILDEIFEKTEDEDLRVNLPELFYYYQLESSSASGKFQILNTETGSPILLEQQFGNGYVIVSSIGADPGWSNFPIKPIFAPLYYRTVLYLATTEGGGFNEHILGDEFRYELSGNPDEIFIEADEERVVPDRQVIHRGLRISDEARNWTPGWVRISAGEYESWVAVNQDVIESDFKTLSEDRLESLLEDHFANVSIRNVTGSESEVSEQMQAAGMGREIWYWFIISAIFLLLTESIVSRLFKAESIE